MIERHVIPDVLGNEAAILLGHSLEVLHVETRVAGEVGVFLTFNDLAYALTGGIGFEVVFDGRYGLCLLSPAVSVC